MTRNRSATPAVQLWEWATSSPLKTVSPTPGRSAGPGCPVTVTSEPAKASGRSVRKTGSCAGYPGTLRRTIHPEAVWVGSAVRRPVTSAPKWKRSARWERTAARVAKSAALAAQRTACPRWSARRKAQLTTTTRPATSHGCPSKTARVAAHATAAAGTNRSSLTAGPSP